MRGMVQDLNPRCFWTTAKPRAWSDLFESRISGPRGKLTHGPRFHPLANLDHCPGARMVQFFCLPLFWATGNCTAWSRIWTRALSGPPGARVRGPIPLNPLFLDHHPGPRMVQLFCLPLFWATENFLSWSISRQKLTLKNHANSLDQVI